MGATLENSEYLSFWNSPDEKRRHELIAGPVPWEVSLGLASHHVDMIVPESVRLTTFGHWPKSDEKKVKTRVLEWGCGHGRVLGEFSKRGTRDLVGLDISEQMIDSASKQLTNETSYLKEFETPKIDLRVISPTGSNKDVISDIYSTVDFIYSFLVFQHMPTREVVSSSLEAMWQLLKPNGIARIQTMKGKSHPEDSFGGFHGHFFENLSEFKLAALGSKFAVLEAQEDLGHAGWLWLTLQKV